MDKGQRGEHPAVAQTTQDQLDEYFKSIGLSRDDPGVVLNVYYGKNSGGNSSRVIRKRSPFKCDVKKHSGYTKADPIKQRGGQPYVCVWFARGMCTKGSDCKCLHRLPDSSDDFDPNVDCFGRKKHSSYRDDYKGVGSFMHVNRSLYVRYNARGHSRVDPKKVRVNFEMYGKIDHFKTHDSYAVVTFANEWNAQFAKEAMANQTLTGKETLAIQWDKEGVESRQPTTSIDHTKPALEPSEPKSPELSPELSPEPEPEPSTKRIKTSLISAENIARFKKAKPSLVDYD